MICTTITLIIATIEFLKVVMISIAITLVIVDWTMIVIMIITVVTMHHSFYACA